MPGKNSTLFDLFLVDPARARAQVLEQVRRQGGARREVADALGVGVYTYDRLVRQWGIADAVAAEVKRTRERFRIPPELLRRGAA